LPLRRLDDLHRDLGQRRSALRDRLERLVEEGVLERVRAPFTLHALHLVAGLLGEAESATPSSAFWQRLCAATCELTGLRRAVVLLYDEPLRDVRAVGAHGVDLDLFADVHVEMAPIARRALDEDRVLVVRADLEDALPTDYVELLGLRTVLISPMSAGGRGYGVLLADRGSEDFAPTEGQQELLWSIGKGAALATASRLATRQQERAKALQDSIDLAREIHDGVVQRLFGVSLALSGAGDLPAEVRERCRDELGLALDDLRTAIQRPLGRRSPETGTTLEQDVRRLARRHPELRVDLGEHPSVPARLEPLAQSVLAEAVRNARKHADPTRIDVCLRRREDALVLEVANDGARPRPAGAQGLGLRLAAFEAIQEGGLLEYGSPRPGCWEVRLTVPVDDDG
jgi:GAF domain-containing protein